MKWSSDISILDSTETLKGLPSLMQALHRYLPASSYPLLPLLRLHSLLLTPPASLIGLNNAIACLATAYSGAEQVYPTGHPSLAIILSEWGKMLAMDIPPEWTDIKQTRIEMMRRLESAIIVLQKAILACEIGFGKKGLVKKEMEGLLIACQGELGLLRS